MVNPGNPPVNHANLKNDFYLGFNDSSAVIARFREDSKIIQASAPSPSSDSSDSSLALSASSASSNLSGNKINPAPASVLSHDQVRRSTN